MSYTTLTVETDSDGIALVTIDVPGETMNVWNDALIDDFQAFVEDFQSNVRTPNPDVSCNSQIKFHKFREHVLDRLKFDRMATGHYVRSVGQPPQLLRGIDFSKDQSYFLSTTAVSGRE